LNIGRRHMPLDHVAADERRVARARRLRNLMLRFHLVNCLDVGGADGEAVRSQMIHPFAATAARGTLEDLDCRLLRTLRGSTDRRKHDRQNDDCSSHSSPTPLITIATPSRPNRMPTMRRNEASGIQRNTRMPISVPVITPAVAMTTQGTIPAIASCCRHR